MAANLTRLVVAVNLTWLPVTGGSREGTQGGTVPPPLFWVLKKEEIREGRKTSRASKTTSPKFKVWICHCQWCVRTIILVDKAKQNIASCQWQAHNWSARHWKNTFFCNTWIQFLFYNSITTVFPRLNHCLKAQRGKLPFFTQKCQMSRILFVGSYLQVLWWVFGQWEDEKNAYFLSGKNSLL